MFIYGVLFLKMKVLGKTFVSLVNVFWLSLGTSMYHIGKHPPLTVLEPAHIVVDPKCQWCT